MVKWIFFFLLILAFLAGGVAFAGLSKDLAKEAVQDFNEAFRAIRGDHLLLPVNYLELDGHSYGYGVSRRFARLAQHDEVFKIRKFKVKKRHIQVEVETENRARLKFKIFDKDQVSQDFLDRVFPAVLHTLFDFGPKPAQVPYVGHSASHLIHLGGCNHLPPPEFRSQFADLEAGIAAGFRPCGVCFPKETVLPYDGYVQLRIESTEQARLFELAFPRVENAEMQARVAAVGEKIVDNFPIDLVGFEYEFAVVHSSIPNAYAVPTGFVYVTDSLLEVIEHPAELEFVLAHAIAHCELALPPIGKGRPFRTASSLSNSRKYVSQWTRFQETTSDLLGVMYLARTNPDFLSAARTILAKLQFAHEALPVMNSDDNDFDGSFAGRLKLFDEQAFQPCLSHSTVVFSPRGEIGGLEVQVLGKALSGDDSLLFLLVEGNDLLNKDLVVEGAYSMGWEFAQIEFANGARFDLVNLDYTFEIGAGDVWVLRTRFGRERDFATLDINSPVLKMDAPPEGDIEY
jgi:hypothetical protein